jgi:mRNA interferase RelE/StbE
MAYNIELVTSAVRQLKRIPEKTRAQIVQDIEELANNPRPDGIVELEGINGPVCYRLRSGNYRIVYTVVDNRLLVLVLRIADRKEAYKKITDAVKAAMKNAKL